MTIDLRYGDTIEQMKFIPDKSIDFICCDLPYGTTQNKEDIIIPFDKLWEQYYRIVKQNGAIILTAQSPFDKTLACSNLKDFKYYNTKEDQIKPIDRNPNFITQYYLN